MSSPFGCSWSILAGGQQVPLAILDIGSQDRKNLNQIAHRGFGFRVRGAVGQRAFLCNAPIGLPDVCIRRSEILLNSHERLHGRRYRSFVMDLPGSAPPHLLAIPLHQDMHQIDPALRHGFADNGVKVVSKSRAQATNEGCTLSFETVMPHPE